MTKTVNGVVTTYYYQGSLLIAEETNSQILVYLYDANGSPVGFRYRGVNYASGVWDTYGFEKNLQGDIVAVYDVSTGTKFISYRYNAWGLCSTTYHNSGSTTTATKNPFKYRGYYYDSDLGLYYLQSRYYDSNTCRFINADGYVSTGQGLTGYNMFAYCNNNPVMHVDYTGENPIAIYIGYALFALVTIAVVAQLSTAIYKANSKESSDSLSDISSGVIVNNDSNVDTAKYMVYSLVDPQTQKVEYVGRTKDPEAREAAHRNSLTRGDLVFTPIHENLSKNQARGLEQYYMIYYHTLNIFDKKNNQINGIALSNPNLNVYAEAVIKYLGNKVSNEFLCWAGI